jgi:hypothetical protein
MHCLDLLKKGIIWRTGNGEKIRIWRDNWIPRGDMKAMANMTNSRVRRVANLINQEEHSWNEDVVKNIFMDHDAKEILKIRLPKYDEEDFVAWTLEKNGISQCTVPTALPWTFDIPSLKHKPKRRQKFMEPHLGSACCVVNDQPVGNTKRKV